MKIDDVAKSSLLFDFYGQLLTDRQRQAMELYHEENLSLSEIAEEFSISRQGVHDALKNAEKALDQYESKLGLVAKFSRSRDAVRKIDDIMDRTILTLKSADCPQAAEAADNMKEVKNIIDGLEE